MLGVCTGTGRPHVSCANGSISRKPLVCRCNKGLSRKQHSQRSGDGVKDRPELATAPCAAAVGDDAQSGDDSDSLTQEDVAEFDRVAAVMAQRLNEIAVGEFGVGVVEDGKTTEKVDVDDIDVDDDVEVEFADLLAEARLDAVEETAEAEPSTSGRAAAPPAPAKRAPAAAPARRGRKPKKEIPVDMLPKVAVVGRPNVGKSALFNRFAGSRLAIVYDQPGVTRDRMYARAHWGGRDYLLIDTGGLMAQAAQLPAEIKLEAMKVISAEGLPSAIERQAAAGISEADAVVMVVDGQEGPNAMESEIIEWLRRVHGGKPVVLAVNKCESPQHGAIQAAAFWEYGLEPFAVSAISGSGTGELLDRLIEVLPREKSREEVEVQDSVAVALVGRPNVGKSSLLNALTGENRAIISSMSGTTRDAVDTDITTPDGEHIKLIDTAGVRKRAAVASSSDGAEPLSVNRALRAMRRADVVVHVIDASIGVSQQDYRLAELVAVEGRACVLVVNKWDVIPDKTDRTLREWQENALAELRPVEWASVVFTSAVTGQRVKNVLKAALVAANEHKRRVSTATLNLVLSDATAWRLPPSSSGSSRKARIYYTTQVGVQPPTFVFFCNDARLITDDYKRYMERQIRENCGFGGTPLRLFWRSKDRIDDGERAVEVR